MTWLHIAALNLIADHDAGIAVDPGRLAAARSFIAKDAPHRLQWARQVVGSPTRERPSNAEQQQGEANA